MNRSEKQDVVDELHKEFGESPHAILVDFRGLSVPAVTEFRRKVRQSRFHYRVVKNSLALRAVKGTPALASTRITADASSVDAGKTTARGRYLCCGSPSHS